jgi:hypothetical protein
MSDIGSSPAILEDVDVRISKKELLLVALTSIFVLLVPANYLPSLLANDDGAYYANQMVSLKPE